MKSILRGIATVLFVWPYRWRWTLAMIILVGGSFAALAVKNIDVVNFKRGSDNIFGMSLGLDLVGGLHLVYQAGDPNSPPTQDQMDGLISTISRRINSLGVAEPSIQQLGKDRLVIELPGLADQAKAESLIGKTAQLEIVERICNANPCDDAHPDNFTDQPTGLTGADMASASPGTNSVTGQPILLFQLNAGAARQFADLTQRLYNTNVPGGTPDQLAFVLDGKILVSAVVNQPITSGSGQITGNFTTDDVRNLAIQIESGRLPVPISKISSAFVTAAGGSQSLHQTLQAGIVGLILVLFFMIAYYRVSGVVAALALIIYTAMVLAIFKLIPVTLTLAGMAGFILSLGMAVDANILIFERMKEEIRVGRSLQFAAQIGFNRAWSSIRDGNVSTLLIAAILFFFGSSGANSSVTGFAVALSIGILTSMFTAIVISKKMIMLIVATALKNFPRAFSPEHYKTATAERGA